MPEFARLAACLTILEIFLFFDMAVDGRWALHSKLIQFSLHFGFYEQRRTIQIVGLATASAALLFGMTMIAHRLRGKWFAIVAGWSALLSVATWCTELVSLHEIDAILCHKVSGFMVIAFVWMTLGATTAISLQLEAWNAGHAIDINQGCPAGG